LSYYKRISQLTKKKKQRGDVQQAGGKLLKALSQNYYGDSPTIGELVCSSM